MDVTRYERLSSLVWDVRVWRMIRDCVETEEAKGRAFERLVAAQARCREELELVMSGGRVD